MDLQHSSASLRQLEARSAAHEARTITRREARALSQGQASPEHAVSSAIHHNWEPNVRARPRRNVWSAWSPLESVSSGDLERC
jgi:hypothetical protein